MAVPLLDGCENSNGCRKLAVNDVRIVERGTGQVWRRTLCAFCTAHLRSQDALDVTVLDGPSQ